jgi:hypothetical protein
MVMRQWRRQIKVFKVPLRLWVSRHHLMFTRIEINSFHRHIHRLSISILRRQCIPIRSNNSFSLPPLLPLSLLRPNLLVRRHQWSVLRLILSLLQIFLLECPCPTSILSLHMPPFKLQRNPSPSRKKRSRKKQTVPRK